MSDLKTKSFQNNVKKVCDKLSDIELVEFSNYLAYGFIDTDFNELQGTLLDELFGLEDWVKFVNVEKKALVKTSIFKPRPWFDLDNYRMIIMFEITKRFHLKVKKVELLESKLKLANVNLEMSEAKHDLTKSKLALESKRLELSEARWKSLKENLKEAVDNSFDDGVFYKDDGWCNVSDVLVSNKLLKL